MNTKDLEERLINFSVLIILIADNLKGRSGYILAGQIVRSGTSCTLNYGEAQSAESTADFIHKLQVVLKELRETFVNLRIIKKSNICKLPEELELALKENNELISIFVATIRKIKDKN